MFLKDRYGYKVTNSFLDYEFESIGPKGKIVKVARFVNLGRNVFSFGFGDFDVKSGLVNDKIITDNKDIEKLMTTLAMIVYEFSTIYSNSIIFIEGPSPSRTRLYQMNINKYIKQIMPLFNLAGCVNNRWEPFNTGNNYERISAQRR